ncbi:MAG TPA: hypothetical protein VD884_03145 [Ohtaekwangia sp.]|nr:hypothetical protein [Ohtaekwangia sp.]
MTKDHLSRLASKEIQDFIFSHEAEDDRSLVLKHDRILGIPSILIAQQIAGRRKAKQKLPSFYNQRGIVYPPGINLEQSSSERAALLKNSLIRSNNIPLQCIVDLTGGFGIDTYFFSKQFETVVHVEPNIDLSCIAAHNHLSCGRNNIKHLTTTAEAFTKGIQFPVDLFYVDPSRRISGNKKVFLLKDCEPDILAMQKQLLSMASFVLIKTSPLLDIQQAIKELSSVAAIYVVAIDGECKELLFLLKQNFEGDPVIIAINQLKEREETFSFYAVNEKTASIQYANAESFLYEPNAAILKAGAFKGVGIRYGLQKLHPHTHLYTSLKLIDDFPGRIFKVKSPMKSNPKDATKFFSDKRVNIITRNYPLRAEALKKKLKLNDGGYQYLIAATQQTGPALYIADRLK